jgi:hypothetical protein
MLKINYQEIKDKKKPVSLGSESNPVVLNWIHEIRILIIIKAFCDPEHCHVAAIGPSKDSPAIF